MSLISNRTWSTEHSAPIVKICSSCVCREMFFISFEHRCRSEGGFKLWLIKILRVDFGNSKHVDRWQLGHYCMQHWSWALKLRCTLARTYIQKKFESLSYQNHDTNLNSNAGRCHCASRQGSVDPRTNTLNFDFYSGIRRLSSHTHALPTKRGTLGRFPKNMYGSLGQICRLLEGTKFARVCIFSLRSNLRGKGQQGELWSLLLFSLKSILFHVIFLVVVFVLPGSFVLVNLPYHPLCLPTTTRILVPSSKPLNHVPGFIRWNMGRGLERVEIQDRDKLCHVRKPL